MVRAAISVVAGLGGSAVAAIQPIGEPGGTAVIPPGQPVFGVLRHHRPGELACAEDQRAQHDAEQRQPGRCSMEKQAGHERRPVTLPARIDDRFSQRTPPRRHHAWRTKEEGTSADSLRRTNPVRMPSAAQSRAGA